MSVFPLQERSVEGCYKQFTRADQKRSVCKNAASLLSVYSGENFRTSQCLINHILPAGFGSFTSPSWTSDASLKQNQPDLMNTVFGRMQWVIANETGMWSKRNTSTLIQQAVCLLYKMCRTWHPATASPSFMGGFMVANQHCCFGSNILISTLSCRHLWTFHLDVMFPSSLNGDEIEVWGEEPVDILSFWLNAPLAAAQVYDVVFLGQ